eukprot:810150-Pleurochrysis_carterae.AAC.3
MRIWRYHSYEPQAEGGQSPAGKALRADLCRYNVHPAASSVLWRRPLKWPSESSSTCDSCRPSQRLLSLLVGITKKSCHKLLMPVPDRCLQVQRTAGNA